METFLAIIPVHDSPDRSSGLPRPSRGDFSHPARRGAGFQPARASFFPQRHLQILPTSVAKMFTGVFKTQRLQICAVLKCIATSLRRAPNYSDSASLFRHSRRPSQFRNHADRAWRKTRAQLAFRRSASFTESIWKLSHSRRIPSAFGTHPAPIRHSFFIPTVAPSPRKARLAHIGNLGKLHSTSLPRPGNARFIDLD